MLGMKGVSFSMVYQHQSNLHIIQNLNGEMYTFDEDTKQCYKTKMPNTTFRCIPGI